MGLVTIQLYNYGLIHDALSIRKPLLLSVIFLF